VFREIKFFGDSEIATLKKELEAHKLQLEQLKSARAERARREEALVGGRLVGGRCANGLLQACKPCGHGITFWGSRSLL